jgi:siroheme synthase (precorrin-2 oxidase/ferrochelatase)
MTPLEAYALRREKGNLLRIAVGSTQNLLEIIRECDVMLAVTDDSVENREVINQARLQKDKLVNAIAQLAAELETTFDINA